MKVLPFFNCPVCISKTSIIERPRHGLDCSNKRISAKRLPHALVGVTVGHKPNLNSLQACHGKKIYYYYYYYYYYCGLRIDAVSGSDYSVEWFDDQ
jgi:hypothetical protein